MVSPPTVAEIEPRPGYAPLDRSLLWGVAVFRVAAWIWMAIAAAVSWRRFDHAYSAAALVVAALVITAGAIVILRRHQDPALLQLPMLVTELAVACLLLGADSWVYQDGRPLSLASAWPVAGVLAAGMAWGWRGGLAAGLLMGAARVTGVILDEGTGGETFVFASTTVLYVMAGVTAGFSMVRLREAEERIASTRAREEVARTLHDGVLQTLAVVQRRSTDDELVKLARDQERDLRSYLFAGPGTTNALLVDELDDRVRKFEATHQVRTQLVVVEQPEETPPEVVGAIAGAVSEALTNAAKHSGATAITVFLEPGDDDSLFCSVKDNGSGFDPASVTEGVGLSKSIRGRMAEVGGHVEIDSRPGRGTEVRLRVANH